MNSEIDTALEQWVAAKAILVVEDITSARMLISGLLRSVGAVNVLIANDGTDALAKLKAKGFVPDIIFCDWVMPEMDGLALLKEIKKDYAAAKFIMLTAKTDREDVLEAKHAGVDGYIGKPFTRKALVEALTRMMVPAA